MAIGGGRISQLDGLRGLAAMIVVFSHIATGFVPALYFGSEQLAVPQWQASFATSPLFVAINGSFAVYIFFVLSGFVIAGSADTSKASIPTNCIARVVRLSVPCSMSVLLAAALLGLRITWISEAAKIVNHKWIRDYIGDYPLRVVLAEASGGYYLTGGSHLNPVLWTMQRDLIGSLAIYIIFGVFRERMPRLVACAVAVLALAVSKVEAHYYLCFVAGSALFLMRDQVSRLPSWAGILALCVGLVLGGRPFAVPTFGSFYYIPYTVLGKLYLYVWPLGAAFIVTGTLLSATAASVLGSPAGRFFGRISFGVYLIHFALLKSLMSYLFVSYGRFGPVEFAISSLVYICTVIAAGFVFTILVVEPATRLSFMVKRRAVSRRTERAIN